MRTLEPLAAASIMTPMMLLALTRRPLQLTHTSLLNCPATWVSLAEARAWSPSLLTISTSCCGIMNGQRRNAYYPFTASAHGFCDDGLERLVAVRQGPDQHRQVDAGDSFDLAGYQQLGGDVGRGTAEHIGQDQHAVPGIQLPDQRAGLRQKQQRVVLRGNAQLAQA